MTFVEDQNAMRVVLPYAAGAAATAGAAVGCGAELYRQAKILRNPDEYIKTVTGEVEAKKKFNNPFFKGTQEAADLANKKLDAYLQKAINFAKGGKLDFLSVLKKTATNAGIWGGVAAGLLGLSFLMNQAIRGVSKTVAEGMDEAKANKA